MVEIHFICLCRDGLFVHTVKNTVKTCKFLRNKNKKLKNRIITHWQISIKILKYD